MDFERALYRSIAGGVLALAGLLAGCGGGDDPAPAPAAPPSSASATIGAAGGTLDGPDGSRVVIPPGALSQDTLIGIARRDTGAPADGPDGYLRQGATYEFTPHDIAFARPVTMRIPAATANPVDDQGVLRASPADDRGWESLGLGATNGYAEWESASFSWYAYWACAYSLPNPDPHPCVGVTGFTSLAPTPANALTLISASPQAANRFFSVRTATSLQMTASYSAAADCGDARIQFKRRRPGSAAPEVLYAGPVTVTPSGTHRISARSSYTVALSDADNGRTALITEFSCRRAYQSPSRAGWSAERQRTGAYDVMVFDAQIPPPQTAPPVITQQPASVSVEAGQSAGFSIAATAPDSLSVDWERSNDGGTTWASLASAGTSYGFVTVLGDNGAQFRVRVCNTAGTLPPNCLYSATVTLTVTPMPGGPQPLRARSIAAGYAMSLAAATDGTVWAWGREVDDLTGGYNAGPSGNWARTPVQVQGLSDVTAVALSSEGSSYYALHADGTVSAWGRNDAGQLGDRTTTLRPLPVKVLQDATTPLAGVTSIVATTRMLFMARADGPWVVGLMGTLGGASAPGYPFNGAIAQAVPAWPAGEGVQFMAAPHSANAQPALLARSTAGRVRAWGYNGSNLLGAGVSTSFAGSATTLADVGFFWSGVGAVDFGRDFAVGLDETLHLVSVGRNLEGQLGNGGSNSSSTLVNVGLGQVSAFATGQASAAALTRASGELWAWGWNGISARPTPERVGTGSGYSSVAVGDIHGLVIGAGGQLHAWGARDFGGLGDGSSSGSSSVPVPVYRP